jgi:hypothetical protein
VTEPLPNVRAHRWRVLRAALERVLEHETHALAREDVTVLDQAADICDEQLSNQENP